ncbi:DUF4403 family protein [Flavobacterium sp.]|uniref:DUF4403 family protein n=1 Tax=Flavobacterium sp. TaxID=239 RepID=UPI002602F0C9|nr:DUF4403 family protein [Flavobacterium sp.]
MKFFNVALLLILLSGCGSTKKIETLRPEPDDATPLIYDNESSFIDLPVTIKLKDIETQANKTLTGLIYEDNNIEDDDYTVKIWKTGNITLENQGGKIKTVLPLKATVNYRYGLGRLLSDTREINLNGKITLSSGIKLTNWKLNTTTELKSLDWTESPSVTIAGRSIPITYLINPGIKLFRAKIEKSIDNTIDKSMDFKSNVLDALEKICTPSEMSADYESWLRIVPLELYSTDATLNKDVISMEMGLKCYIETLVGKKPDSKFDRTKIVLKPVAKMPDKITANIVAVSTFKDASKIMTKNFQGQEFGSGNKKVTVQNVALWHKDGKMVIALDLLGSVTGTIYLAGFPQYNDTSKEIFFDQLDYAIDTKSKLVRAANWLASGYILKKIQETCRYSIKPNLEEGKQNMLKYMKNYSPMPGVFINGTMNDIQFKKMQLTNKAIIAFLSIDGKVDVKVDGLK